MKLLIGGLMMGVMMFGYVIVVIVCISFVFLVLCMMIIWLIGIIIVLLIFCSSCVVVNDIIFLDSLYSIDVLVKMMIVFVKMVCEL